MFSSLRARLLFSYAFIIVTVLAVVAVVLIVFLIRNPSLYRETALRLKAAESLLTRSPQAAARSDAVAQAFNVRVLVFSSNGILLEDSDAGTGAIALPPKSLAGRPFPTVRDSAGKLWLYSVVLRADGSWLMVAAPRPRLAAALAVWTDELARPLLQGGLIALLLSLVVAYALARWIANPIQQLITATRRFPTRSFQESQRPFQGAADRGGLTEGKSVPEKGPDEVRELTRAFNAMMTRVEAGQRSQREFVANVSHELKTPLTSIQGFAQALVEDAAETPEARRHAAEIIYNEAGRMHRMALDLLDLARLDAGTAELQISTVDVRSLLQRVADRFGPMAVEAGVSLRLDLQQEIPSLSADGDRLSQVFSNLVDNALKFTPRGGLITLQAVRQKDEIEVSITDSGQGIPKEDLPHIFDRFYQADSARGGGKKHGAGLGLAIAREIVGAHGGRISVRSKPGQGTGFKVYLPLRGSK